ncbi:YbaB/EbfC family DNA-binding protein [Patescibacteria group bacterium]|nr:MAG: YbaB/EbfC family DNA-binding protein [Patescibacteria group bacterium]
MFNKIKAVKNLRDQAKIMQNALEEVVAEGEAGWGKVKVKLNGNQRILDIEIADELMADKSKLVELLKEAFADAVKKLQKQLAGRMKDMGGLQEAMKQLGM